ncbi:MAG TPA: HD domain-containing phosphohydrolase [Terriglobales bacterium]|nr:HD domain-containing phosphohydrolase [Terriglobales bacterium]
MAKVPLPNRVPILYLIIGVLGLVSVIPMYFYARQVVALNRDRLKTNEMLLQNTITRALSDAIAQRMANLDSMLGNLSSAIQVTSGGDISMANINAPELRALLERFVSSSGDIAYATILNNEGKGQAVGRINPDEFLQNELMRGFNATREGRSYTGQALSEGSGSARKTMIVVAVPVTAAGRIIGMLAAAVDLSFLQRNLDQISRGGLLTYVVDRNGRLIAAPEASHFATGQDMSKIDIVHSFVEKAGNIRWVVTSEFAMDEGKKRVDMLGTCSPVPSLEWAVVAQKPQSEAYSNVYEMQEKANLLALAMVILSVFVGILLARRITGPLESLTESSRAIARGDFSQRVKMKSRTEIGELASTFNIMSEDLERLIADLKLAAEKNRHLFLNSIQMLAGAVDEKDPYTKGHSDRVTKYSVMIAREIGLSQEEVEKIRIAAQLHDVGKIGIEDRILKKPGALTPEEYEVMKSHTVRGANILRPVEQLREMIPGIELHHESMDGKGYPYGLKGNEIPLSARIIAVADTFDAMTTNRPYQAAHEPEYAVKIINTLARNRLDPRVVAALTKIFERGELRMHRAAVIKESVPQPASVPAPVIETPNAEAAVTGD